MKLSVLLDRFSPKPELPGESSLLEARGSAASWLPSASATLFGFLTLFGGLRQHVHERSQRSLVLRWRNVSVCEIITDDPINNFTVARRGINDVQAGSIWLILPQTGTSGSIALA